MSNIAIEIKDDFINELVQSKVESILKITNVNTLQLILKI